MRIPPKLIRVVFLGSAIAASLAFGANEARGCLTCITPPATACEHLPFPDLFCLDLCVNNANCEFGMCLPIDECVCLEK